MITIFKYDIMKQKLILICAIVLLIASNILLYKQMRQNKNDAVRWEDNYVASQEQAHSISMTLDEFKESTSVKEDSLLNALKIKPKQVDRIVYVKNTYIKTDTVEIPLIETSEPDEFYFIDNIDCTQIEGVITVDDGFPSLELTKLAHYNEIAYVVYQKRRQWKLLGIKTRIFGKKKTKLEVTSSCGETQVHEIDIIKE